jgi:GNAT superfamily N-acetyltransferase
MWRFDTEENEEGKEEPIIYLLVSEPTLSPTYDPYFIPANARPAYLLLTRYELQVSSSHQKEGFGRLLVENVERIGSETGMRRVLLTVLKGELEGQLLQDDCLIHARQHLFRLPL